MKLGIVGGTFDPIHAAHCYLMEECLRVLALDELLVIPNGDPPHKTGLITPAVHRLAMARLALAGYEHLTVSDMETADPDVSFTWKTLKKLKAEQPEADLYFIMGADSLITFHTWRHPEIILECAVLVCFDRSSYRAAEVEAAVRWVAAAGGQVRLVDSLELEISSTDIRHRVANGLPHRAFLHPAVYDYIHRHGLYKALPLPGPDGTGTRD